MEAESEGDVTIDAETGTSRVEFDEDGDTDVRSVTFQGSVRGQARVQQLSEVPESDPEPPGRVVSLTEIQVPEQAEDTPATIELSIDRDRFDQQNIDSEDATVVRLSGGEWQPLPTEVDAGGERVVMRADTPGFSRFAVVDIDETPTPTPTTIVTESPTSTPTSPPETETTESGGLDRFGILVSAIALAAGALLAKRRSE